MISILTRSLISDRALNKKKKDQINQKNGHDAPKRKQKQDTKKYEDNEYKSIIINNWNHMTGTYFVISY